MIKVDEIEGFKKFPTTEKKNKIILSHTSRNLKDYITSLKTRYNGEYTKIPHFVISKEGKVFGLLDELMYSDFFGIKEIDTTSIHICLENYGWFDKIPLENRFINWIGDIYKENVFEKKWRDYFFWDYYTEKQINSCLELCKYIIINQSIEKKFIGHNIKVDGVNKYTGILSRSNFSTHYTDLNPSFKFEFFKTEIEK